MNKKVTIKDVAEAAGVCKATVSYVLNDRKDQKISEETKKKVWQVVNMLGYRPNAFAQNMRTAVARQMFGVYLPSDLNALERAMFLDFLKELIAVAREEDANIVLLPSVPERVNTADAIVTFFLTREQFFALGESNFIPILSVDCRIDDALFFEIAPDYAALRAQADAHFQAPYRYVCIPPRDETLKREIEGAFENVTFVRGLSDLASIPEGNCFITQTVLLEALSGRKDVFCADGIERRTAERAAACIRLALSHEPCKQHIFKVS